MSIKKALHEKDTRAPWGSWAPGGYMCSCITCGRYFEGDKRAVVCADCAYARKQVLESGVKLASEAEDA